MDEWIALCVSSAGFTGFLPGLLSKWRLGWGGTMGSLVAVYAQYQIMYCNAQVAVDFGQFGGQLILVVATLFLGLAAIGPAEEMLLRRWGPRRRHNGELAYCDFNETCLDEVHGQLIAGLPVYLFKPGMDQCFVLVMSFLLFRFFDAKKIGPVRWAENRFTGALGVMLDDTVAGVMAAVFVVPLVLFLDWLGRMVS